MHQVRKKINAVLFDSDQLSGRLFDIVLMVVIVLSILTVMLESVESIRSAHAGIIAVFELLFTSLFTLEYVLRIVVSENKRRYAFSFFGIIDFIAAIPGWIAFFSVGHTYILVIRLLRLFRILRILKLTRFIGEADVLSRALMASRYKITLFIAVMSVLVVILGTVMYVVEGEASGFTSIPRSIYWAIITLTTVGFGDIVPRTVLGQAVSSLVMILGYGIIVVPTGILTSETIHAARKSGQCPSCSGKGHDADAVFCKYCGHRISQTK